MTEEEINKIKQELSVSPYICQDYVNQRPKPFKLYQESESKLYLPKYYGIQKFGAPNTNKLHSGHDINVSFCGNLRHEQEEPVRKFLDAARDPSRMGGILNVFCGGGKTTMAIYIMCQLRKKTMVVCHKDVLLQQWKERINQFSPDAKVGLLKAKTIDIDNKDVVIASLQSLSMKDYPENLWKEFGFVIVDECHHTSAEVFSKALKKVNFMYSLGLSATIKRKDGLTKVFLWHLGGVVHKATKRHDTLQVNLYEFYQPNPLYSMELKGYGKDTKLNVSGMINNICNYQPRTEFIVKILKAVLEKEPNRKVFVLSDRRQHLKDLHDTFHKIGLSSGFYVGGMKHEDLKKSEEQQIILATYHIASEGFDCPGLDTLILASPKSDVIQCVGRILRTPEHLRVHVPLVIDIVDNFSLFAKQGKKRYTYYKSCGYKVLGKELFDVSMSSNINLKGHCFIEEDQ
jgi:superfamily II DNA or RNA helicase